MAPARVAELIGKAAYYKVDECWIAQHPVLLMGQSSFLACFFLTLYMHSLLFLACHECALSKMFAWYMLKVH